MVLGGVLMHAIDRWQASLTDARPAPAIEQLVRGFEPPAAGPPIRAAEPGAPAPLQEAPASAARAADPIVAVAVTPNTPESEAAQRAGQRAAERMDRAWARIYQKPAYCDENPTRAIMVECANHYIRARREFEANYGSGKR